MRQTRTGDRKVSQQVGFVSSTLRQFQIVHPGWVTTRLGPVSLPCFALTLPSLTLTLAPRVRGYPNLMGLVAGGTAPSGMVAARICVYLR